MSKSIGVSFLLFGTVILILSSPSSSKGLPYWAASIGTILFMVGGFLL